MPCQSNNPCNNNQIRLWKFKLNIKWVPSISWWNVTLNFGNKTNIDLSKIWSWETTWVAWWSTDLVFQSNDNDTVSWNDWNIYFPDNTTYTILSWDTWDMTSTTYIYLNETTSTLLTTTTPQDAVGKKKLLVCVAWPVTDTSKKAEFQVFWTKGSNRLITWDTIAGNTIAGNSIIANDLTSREINTSTITITDLWNDDYKRWAWKADDALNSSNRYQKWLDANDVWESKDKTNYTWVILDSGWLSWWNDWSKTFKIDSSDWSAYFKWTIWASSIESDWYIDIKDSDNNEIKLYINWKSKLDFRDAWNYVWWLTWSNTSYNWLTYHLIKADTIIWSTAWIISQNNNSNIWAISWTNSWWDWVQWESTKDSNSWIYWHHTWKWHWVYWHINTDDTNYAAVYAKNDNNSWRDLLCDWSYRGFIPYSFSYDSYVQDLLHLYDSKHTSRYSYLKVNSDTWDLQRIDAWWTTHTLATYW